MGQKTGTTFPIDIHNQKVYALYDTGAGCSLINYSMYETLGTDLDKEYMPHVRSSTGEDIEVLGQVTYTFKINGMTFTQSFIVCRNMNQHMILGTDLTAKNFVGVIWTCERTQKLMHSNGKTIMELQDTTTSILLAMAYSVKIEPEGHRTVPLESSRQLEDQMDIRVDAGFHHRNPNVYIPPSCINNPGNEFHPKSLPTTIFNLSKVDHLYIGRDTVYAFADKPTVDAYHVEIASDEKIKEHLGKPRNWVLQHHETLPEITSNTTFICSLADVPGHHKVHLQDKEISADVCQRFEELCEEYGEAFSKHNEDIGRTKLVKMDIDTGDSPPISSRPYTLPLKHYE